MGKIIIISNDNINVNMSGPGIRYYNFARELSKYFQVVLLTPNRCDFREEFKITQFEKQILKKEAKNAKCIILQGSVMWKNPFIKKLMIPIVVDLYDPFFFEQIEENQDRKNGNLLHKSVLSIALDQLLNGDFFICASEKQKDFWIGMLTAINRINPVEYAINKSMEHLIAVVPFGIQNEKAVKTKAVLKGVYPGIKKEDKVILWGGGLWSWLDAITAVEAIHEISKKRDDIKLFFMGTKYTNLSIANEDNIKKVMELSNQLNLTNRYIFFNDWVEYNQRHNYLLESDIGLNLHYDHLETRYAFRTRMLDYIWCDLPIVTSRGDIISELISKNDIGKTVIPQDVNQVVEAIEILLEREVDESKYDELRKAYSWEAVVLPLVRFCSAPAISEGKHERLKIKHIPNKYVNYLLKVSTLILQGDFSTIISKLKQYLFKS